MSARFCEFAFAVPVQEFPEIAEAILALVVKAEGEYVRIHNLQELEVVRKYPAISLALLYAILPSQIAMWPYDIDKAFDQLENGNSALAADLRLVELRRQWHAR